MKTISIPDAMWRRLLDNIDGGDYCPLCDCHPSSGHDKDCPVGQDGQTRPSEEEQ